MRLPNKTSIRDLASLIEDFFYVETKDGRVAPFILNNKQNQLIDDFEACAREREIFRFLILKSRQFGFSTLVLALFLVKCMTIENTRAAVISHNEDATKKLFRRVRFFLSKMPYPASVDKESEKELSFPKTNSYFYIGTAGQRAFGRGDNLTDLHCSEVAFWENAAVVMNGLMQAVGKTGNAIIETTANGIGNYLNRLWQKSYQIPSATWDARFYGWTDFREYELPVPPGFQPTAYEQMLQGEHPELTPNKLAWRRFKINETETDGSISPEDLFRQEYPLTPQEAFIATGRPVFNLEALLAYQTIDIKPEGYLTIFEKPAPFTSYFIGGDVAEGIEGGDFSCLQVIDNAGKQVAEWHGHIDPDQFGIEAVSLAKYYNQAILGIEANNQGLASLNAAKAIYPLHKIHHTEVLDENFHKMTKKIGWRTTVPSRLLMIADMMQFIREQKLIIRSPKLIAECLSFVRNKQGKPEAQEGCNDDRVMAMAIAIQMWKAYPYLVKKPPAPPAIAAQKRFDQKMKRLKMLKAKQVLGNYNRY